MKKRKRKGRIRWNRVFMVLFILIFIIWLIKFINYTIYNNKMYNNVVNSSATNAIINKKYKKLKLYKKTIELIKSDNVSIVIKDKKTKVYLNSSNVERKMPLKVKVYNDKLKYKNFPNIKSLFIDNTELVKKSYKIEVNLPKYLLKEKIVDVYGVKEDGTVNEILLSKKVEDTITFRTNEKFEKYFVTYVPLEDIKISDTTVNVGAVVNLNIKYVPSTATVKTYEYTSVGGIFMINEKGKIIAKKSGTSEITIKHTISNIEKTALIKVNEEEIKIENKDGLTYVDGILIANKTYSLPKDYDPKDLSEEVKQAFNKMKEDALNDGIELWIQSGYRSYETQENLYNNYVQMDGIETADTYSARPGHSEHQTGLAMDLNIIDSSFEGTPEAIWIEENSYKYGFIVRYPKGKEYVTGYKYEPWHIRYLGMDIAKKVHDSNKTLEEYLGIDSKYKD